jgi:hypothetical protein
MASFSRADVEARLPIKEMMDRFNKERGLKSKFFNAVPNADKKNLAFQFTRLANGEQDALPTGNATLDGIVDTWQNYVKTGSLPGALPGGDAPKRNGNGNNSDQPTPPPTGTQQRREQEAAAVPPVSHSVANSAKRVFDLVRQSEVDPPANAGEAYGLLWDHLDPTVKLGPGRTVIADTLANLASTDRDRFNLVLNDLPDPVREAIMDSLEEHAEASINSALADSVRRIYHISIGRKYGVKYFDYWAGQLTTTLEWMGRDEDIDWEPSDEQRTEAYKGVATAAFRVLAEGLLKEARSIDQPKSDSILQPIPFDTIVERIPADQVMTMARQWGRLSADEQHAYVNGLAAEGQATAPEQPETEAPAEGQPETAAPEQPEQPNRGRQARQAGRNQG